MTTQAPPTNEELLAERDTQIERRQNAESAGIKAAATTKIKVIEATLRQNGYTDFEPFVPDTESSTANLDSLSDEALQSAHTDAVNLRQSTESAGVKAATTTRIKRIEEELGRRNEGRNDADKVQFEAYAPQQPAQETLTDEQLVDLFNDLTQQRETAISPGVKAALTRRLSGVLAECAKRNIDPVPTEGNSGNAEPAAEPAQPARRGRGKNGNGGSR